MTPTNVLVSAATTQFEVTDAAGRRLRIKAPTALDTLRLLKAAGAALAENHAWLSLASIAMAVVEIDGVPVVTPTTEAQIEGLVERLGDVGLDAASQAIERNAPAERYEDVLTAGNSPGTPT